MNRILPISSPLLFQKHIRHVNRFVAFLTLIFLLFAYPTQGQKISGQWIGGFTSSDDPSNSKTDYVLEMEQNGNSIIGYSYTYFSMAGKRYYVICKLKGNYDPSSKSMVVNEVEQVKTNTPPDFQNCLQSHELTYFKKGDVETLIGKWKPVEKGSTCGRGQTEVERKTLNGLNTAPNSAKSASPAPAPKNEVKSPEKTGIKTNQTPAPSTAKPESKPIVQHTEPQTDKTSTSPERKVQIKPEPKTISSIESGMARPLTDKEKAKLSKRSYQVIQTIEVDAPVIKVEIYDNGQVDGDTVSIFLNEKLLVPAKMLTAKPISIEIKVNADEDTYDLIMYAETLGSIPPNTALMVVTTPKNRYEINITSTEQTSGAVRFKVKR